MFLFDVLIWTISIDIYILSRDFLFTSSNLNMPGDEQVAHTAVISVWGAYVDAWTMLHLWGGYFLVIKQSLKCLMWVKQSKTTHLGSVYTTYLW